MEALNRRDTRKTYGLRDKTLGQFNGAFHKYLYGRTFALA